MRMNICPGSPLYLDQSMDSSNAVPSENDLDLISNMADSILGKILSYVPTRWRNLFPFGVPPITLYLDDNKPEFPYRSFVNFVDKLLNETLSDEQKLVLRCGKGYDDDDDKIVSWVCAAAIPLINHDEVHLRLMCEPNNSETLFRSMNGCTTLVELELGENFLLCLPQEEFVLPNLKRLLLYSLLLCEDTTSIHHLLYACPMLDDLSFIECELQLFNILYIDSLLLKRLFIKGCLFAFSDVMIYAPNLQVFEYKGNLLADYYAMEEDFKSLHSVSIEFDSSSAVNDFEKVSRLARLVEACSSTNRLYLSGNSITALHHASVRLPTFQNLTCVTLGLITGIHGWRILAHLLQNAPNLHTFMIEKGFKDCRGGYGKFKSTLPAPPDCLKLCMKKIEFWEFKGAKDEIKLIEYFLKNGIILQAVTIHYLPCVSRSIFSRLLKFPKHSETCQILLTEKDNCSSTRLKSLGLRCFNQCRDFMLKHKPTRTSSCFRDLTS